MKLDLYDPEALLDDSLWDLEEILSTGEIFANLRRFAIVLSPHRGITPPGRRARNPWFTLLKSRLPRLYARGILSVTKDCINSNLRLRGYPNFCPGV